MLNYDFDNPDFQEFYFEVKQELLELGYSENFVRCFRYDIYEYFEKQYSVEKAVKEIA